MTQPAAEGGRRTPRPRYPSDDARLRVKPHVRIHHSITNHPRMVRVWPDNDLLACWLRVMLLASRQGAAHTGDILHLTPADVELLSGRRRRDVALTLLGRLADVMGWWLERRGNVTLIHVRNFARKQGLTPQLRGVPPRTPFSSPSPSPSTVVEGEYKPAPQAPQSAPNGAELSAPGALFSPVTKDEIVGAWQDICVPRGAPAVREVTGERDRKLRLRMRAHPTFEWWQDVFRKMAASPFLFGNGTRGWRVTFDWLINNDTNAVKILEGQYGKA
jgi:hypothetical protein